MISAVKVMMTMIMMMMTEGESSSAHLGMIFVRRMIGVVQIAMRIFQDFPILGTEGLLLWAGDCQLYLCVCLFGTEKLQFGSIRSLTSPPPIL